MANTNKTTDTVTTTDEPKLTAVPQQKDREQITDEVIDLAEHVKVSFGAKIKNAMKNKKVLVTAGGVVLTVVTAVVLNSRRSTVVTDPTEEENTSV